MEKDKSCLEEQVKAVRGELEEAAMLAKEAQISLTGSEAQREHAFAELNEAKGQAEVWCDMNGGGCTSALYREGKE